MGVFNRQSGYSGCLQPAVWVKRERREEREEGRDRGKRERREEREEGRDRGKRESDG